MSHKINDIWNENLEELREEAEKPTVVELIKMLDLIRWWYSKNWISEDEYLRLYNLYW